MFILCQKLLILLPLPYSKTPSSPSGPISNNSLCCPPEEEVRGSEVGEHQAEQSIEGVEPGHLLTPVSSTDQLEERQPSFPEGLFLHTSEAGFLRLTKDGC
jgi:hypothetical protein